MKFKKIRGVRLSYEQQGLIFFALANYKTQPLAQRRRIDNLIREVCRGDPAYEGALRAWLLDGRPFEVVSAESFVNAATLGRLRKKLYESW
ncbi:MAG: hypothetical protein J6K89_08620 [Oscillospiraceae bacterium]|nr:hypothetical protein [Oscillospiraceae bacterium]